MTVDADIRDQAYEFFIQEAPELLLVIETELVTLSQDRNTNKIHNMMRAAHSLKGGSASVGLPVISELSHKLEDFFKTLHHPELEIDNELEDLFLLAFDCLKLSVTEQIETGRIDPNYIAEVMAPTLGRIEAKLGDFLGSETELPNSIDLGVDIALSIFEVDVAEGLERLREILDSPQNYMVAGELRAQAEVFSGISELLNMPGLGAIAQATINALDINPSMVTEIAHYAMQDFEAARQGVIAGDRIQGGYPSEQLLELSKAELASLDFSDLDALLNDSSVQVTSIYAESSTAELTDLDLMFGDSISYSDRRDIPDQSLDESLQVNDELSLDDLFGETSDTNIDNTHLDEQLLLPVEEIFSGSPSFSPDKFQLNIQSESEIDLDSVFRSEAVTNNFDLDDLFDSSLNLKLTSELTGESVIELAQEFDRDLDDQLSPMSMDDVFGEDLSNDLNDNFASNFVSNFDDVFAHKKITNNLTLDDVFTDSIPLGDSEPTFIQDTSLQDTSASAQVSGQIGDTVENITNGKDDLQEFTISDIPPSTVAKSAIAPTKPPTPRAAANYTSTTSLAVAAEPQLSVRINLDRLEQMNNLVGELAINRNVLSLQNEQLQNIVQELLRRFGKFRQVTNRLRTVADQTVTSDRNGSNSQQVNSNSLSTAGFDSLELDTYGELYGVMQTALEDLAQIEETVEDVTLLSGQSVQTLEQQRQTVTRLRDDLMWARMLPLSEVLNRFPRNIRDLSSKYQKPVDLKLSGTGVLVDKAILEKLTDPLQHLLRNAFDHGIEPSAIRLDQHKPERGQIEIRAYHQGSQTIIEVRDDGQGIDLERIRHKAIAQSLITADQEFSERQLLDLMFQPGFSTTDKVSELSGRGVGLDVVRSQIQALKGSVSVGFEWGKGTTFTLRIPLTLSIANLLICTVGTSVLAVASSSIEEIVVPKLSQVSHSPEGRKLQWREQTIPIRHLSEFLEFRCPLPESLPNSSLVSVPTPSDWALPLLIIRSDQELLALEIDRLITEQELVIKPLGLAIAPPKFIYGCTILGDGSLIPIINSQELLEVDLSVVITIPPETNAPLQSDTLLIVDDSIALRQTLALTLQKAGFRVLQAKDGQEAIEQLEKNSTIQLVICDIEMPNMNGFEFLTARRQNPNLNKTPVIMLTSRSSDKHRRLAMHLGASSYFTKPYLEREFITAIKNTLTSLV